MFFKIRQRSFIFILFCFYTLIFALIRCSNARDDLGTYDNPEHAFNETKKALDLLSENINEAQSTTIYINEYQQSKNRIFK